jgi:hypothetical protein
MLPSFWRNTLVMDGFHQTRSSVVAVVPWLPILYLFHAGLTGRAVTHALSVAGKHIRVRVGRKALISEWSHGHYAGT